MRVPRTALGEILVGRADEHALDARVAAGNLSGRRQRIVGLVFDHRPHRDAQRGERFLEHGKLREQFGFDAGTRLVSRPEPIAKRLDDVVGGDADVRGAGGDQAEHRADHAADRGHFPSRGVFRRRKGVVVAEQLVGAVDQVNVQKELP